MNLTGLMEKHQERSLKRPNPHPQTSTVEYDETHLLKTRERDRDHSDTNMRLLLYDGAESTPETENRDVGSFRVKNHSTSQHSQSTERNTQHA